MVSDKPKLQILIGGLVNWLTDRFGLLVWLVQLDKHRSAKREVQIPASGEKKCCICNTIYKRLDLLAGLSQMSRCLLYAISRWGIEQPRSSFGSISFPFPMTVAVADGGARGGPVPPPIIFRSNWGPKGQKIVFWSPPPYLRVWMTTPPPRPYLKVWIRALSSLRWCFYIPGPRHYATALESSLLR